MQQRQPNTNISLNTQLCFITYHSSLITGSHHFSLTTQHWFLVFYSPLTFHSSLTTCHWFLVFYSPLTFHSSLTTCHWFLVFHSPLTFHSPLLYAFPLSTHHSFCYSSLTTHHWVISAGLAPYL